MAEYQYRVVPFIGRVRSNQSADEVGQQLQAVIDEYAGQGWEFHTLGNVNIEIRPGCLAGIFGASVSYVRFDQLIFRREPQ